MNKKTAKKHHKIGLKNAVQKSQKLKL